MNRGLYTAAVGMTTQMNKMDVVSNNIANVNTTGYKKDEVVTRSFDEEMMLRLYNDQDLYYENKNIGTMNMGVTVDNIYTDFSNGSFQTTGADLDFALNGDGFFVVETYDSNGNAFQNYTRDGRFKISEDSKLVTSEGYYVLDTNGQSIDVGEATTIGVNDRGQIFSNDEFLGQIAITSFEDNAFLKKEGENLYSEREGATKIASNAMVMQGYTEASNVNTVKEMVEMITLSRAYEANQKVISNYDTIMGKTASEVGRR